MENLLYRNNDNPGAKGGMANSSNHKSRPASLEGGQKYNVRRPMLYYIIDSFFTSTHNLSKENKMATLKGVWLFLHILGWSAYGTALILSILPPSILAEIQLTDIKEPWKTIVIIAGILWIAQRIYVGYQNGRGKKIENDEREHELNVRKHHDKLSRH